MGYQTCHELKSSLDASICAKDCERLKKEKFAKNCKNKGGLYKCCIRRDDAKCNECRYFQISGIILISGIRLRYKYQVSTCSHKGFQITCPGSAAHYPSAPIRHPLALATQLSMTRYHIPPI